MATASRTTSPSIPASAHGDEFIREPLFDLQDQKRNYLNPACTIYQEIAKISQQVEALHFGRMYLRSISGDGRDFGFPQSQPCTLAFSRILAYQEVLVAYNTSTTQARNDYVIVDQTFHQPGNSLHFLYGAEGAVQVQKHPDPTNPSMFVQLTLAPMQFVILR